MSELIIDDFIDELSHLKELELNAVKIYQELLNVKDSPEWNGLIEGLITDEQEHAAMIEQMIELVRSEAESLIDRE